MIKSLAIAALVSSAAAFAPAGKPATTTSALNSAFENELGVQEPVSENSARMDSKQHKRASCVFISSSVLPGHCISTLA